jgi:hypothetical protein
MIITLQGGPLDGAFHRIPDGVLETHYELFAEGSYWRQKGYRGRLLFAGEYPTKAPVVLYRREAGSASTTFIEFVEVRRPPREDLPRRNNLHEIDQIWRLHAPPASSGRPCGCRAFVVDQRYALEATVENRLAVSYGANPFTPKSDCWFVPSPLQRLLEQDYVFGVHGVSIHGRRMELASPWLDARAADGHLSPKQANEAALAILAGYSDEDIAWKTWNWSFLPGTPAKPSQEDLAAVRLSPLSALDDFAVVQKLDPR